ncbi:uncharacterized protein N7496_000998 [Penicillium cataractarum]|uniref:Uncharacterized protein n=1 Tax=Penicillium cataractarum TaxID=2100454 RepID=A0A9X0B6H2_9EURO|nr:uncharacterized protein N7496_000998 [Penicillium cataractarum]KAJ5389930.1 hypothetical protein N7496_000998 [Penicillium cataractarum]
MPHQEIYFALLAFSNLPATGEDRMIPIRSAGKPNLQWTVQFQNLISHGVLASRPLLTCGQVGFFEELKMEETGPPEQSTEYMGGGGVDVDRG